MFLNSGALCIDEFLSSLARGATSLFGALLYERREDP